MAAAKPAWSGSSTPRRACVYNADKQRDPNVIALKEEDAYPAMPEDGYGWEKLFQRADVPPLPRGFRPARRASPGFTTSTARTALGTAAVKKPPPPSAAKSSRPSRTGKHEIEIWGDGKQTRSFMYIDDCIQGIHTIMDSDIIEPINLGSQRTGHDQPAGRHRRGHRRHQAQAELQPRTRPRASTAATATTR